MKRFLCGVLAVLLPAALCACGAQETATVRLSEVTHSVFYAPQYVALEQGFFADEGLKIELSNGGGADKVMTAVLTGQADIGLAGPEACIYVYNQGKDDHPVVFGQLTKRDGSFLVGREDVPFSWELLRGRRLDVAVIEISMGIRMPYAEERGFHLGAKAAIAFRDRLAELGAVTASTQVAVTHISHHVGATHEELEAYFRPYGMLVGYDGMLLGRA